MGTAALEARAGFAGPAEKADPREDFGVRQKVIARKAEAAQKVVRPKAGPREVLLVVARKAVLLARVVAWD